MSNERKQGLAPSKDYLIKYGLNDRIGFSMIKIINSLHLNLAVEHNEGIIL